MIENKKGIALSENELGAAAGGVAQYGCIVIYEESCQRCYVCEEQCPAGAINIENCMPVINTDLCLNCGMCEAHCPAGAIEMVG